MSVLTYATLIDTIKAAMPNIYYLTDPNLTEGMLYRCQPNLVCEHELWILHPDDLSTFMGIVKTEGANAIDQRDAWKQEQVAFNGMMSDNAKKYKEEK